MMEIRRVTADEMIQCGKIGTIAFNERERYDKPDEDAEDAEDALEHPPEWTWACVENGVVKGCMVEIQFLMRFDHQNVKMSGIGGVGVLPEARGKGCVRLIFEKLLPEAYEKGVVFSSLTPFSHAFYRQFGYELACVRNRVAIPTNEFAHLKPRGQFVQIFPGDDAADLNAVHRAYIANLNHGICRDYWENDRAWRRFTSNDPYSTGVFLYIWRNDEGKPKSYIKYENEKDGDGGRMAVRELAFVDKEGLYGALGLAHNMSSQCDAFTWDMPSFIEPFDFVSDMWSVERRVVPRDMTRIINVQAALERMRRPAGEGQFVIDVIDPHISANQRRFLVEYAPEGSRVSVTRKDADMKCTIAALSQLVVGFRTLENALLSKQTGLEAPGDMETLRNVWTLRPQHVTEYF
ncbi:MAG: GNAT family N-acetyltransferase [Treponema sp.]|jgi:predicted acetyltransferase|nr:GNAT family N-acetyltransferase [Treponema sp.]